MEADPTRMCELLVGLGEVDLVRINDSGEGAPLEVMIRSRKARPVCEACGGRVWSKGYRTVVLVDLLHLSTRTRPRPQPPPRYQIPELAPVLTIVETPHSRSVKFPTL